MRRFLLVVVVVVVQVWATARAAVQEYSWDDVFVLDLKAATSNAVNQTALQAGAELAVAAVVKEWNAQFGYNTVLSSSSLSLSNFNSNGVIQQQVNKSINEYQTTQCPQRCRGGVLLQQCWMLYCVAKGAIPAGRRHLSSSPHYHHRDLVTNVTASDVILPLTNGTFLFDTDAAQIAVNQALIAMARQYGFLLDAQIATAAEYTNLPDMVWIGLSPTVLCNNNTGNTTTTTPPCAYRVYSHEGHVWGVQYFLTTGVAANTNITLVSSDDNVLTTRAVNVAWDSYGNCLTTVTVWNADGTVANTRACLSCSVCANSGNNYSNASVTSTANWAAAFSPALLQQLSFSLDCRPVQFGRPLTCASAWPLLYPFSVDSSQLITTKATATSRAPHRMIQRGGWWWVFLSTLLVGCTL